MRVARVIVRVARRAARSPGGSGLLSMDWTRCGLETDRVLASRSARLGDRLRFTHDLAERVSQRVQITTDGLRVYLEAVESAFWEDVDYAALQKIYGSDMESERRYSPAKIVSSTSEVIKGTPDPKHISTSYVERLNWSTRTSMRRYTRLSNGFSRKLENHEAAVALNYFAYNFHQDSQDAAGFASNGSQGHGTAVRRVRHRGVA